MNGEGHTAMIAQLLQKEGKDFIALHGNAMRRVSIFYLSIFCELFVIELAIDLHLGKDVK